MVPNHSIVQGRAVLEPFCIPVESDINILSRNKEIFTYADDTILLVPRHSGIPFETKNYYVSLATRNNKTIIEVMKIKELVF
jgi:hypothetical protein